MNRSDVESILTSTGFSKTGSSNFGHEYSREVQAGWEITAYASIDGNGFGGKSDPETVTRVDPTLDSKGTKHRVLSLNSPWCKCVNFGRFGGGAICRDSCCEPQ